MKINGGEIKGNTWKPKQKKIKSFYITKHKESIWAAKINLLTPNVTKEMWLHCLQIKRNFRKMERTSQFKLLNKQTQTSVDIDRYLQAQPTCWELDKPPDLEQ